MTSHDISTGDAPCTCGWCLHPAIVAAADRAIAAAKSEREAMEAKRDAARMGRREET